MTEWAVFLKEPVVAMNKYVVEAETKEEALALAKEGKAGEPELIELVQRNPELEDFMGFDYAVVDDNFYAHLDYPPAELYAEIPPEEEE